MPNHILIAGTLAAVGWAVVNTAPNMPAPTARPANRTVAGTNLPPSQVPTGLGPALVNSRPPVPLLRSPKSTAAASTQSDVPPSQAEPQKQDDLDRRAAKLAVEADGYKRVSIVGKANNGAWRVKAYRGTTELVLIVDGTGRVSME